MADQQNLDDLVQQKLAEFAANNAGFLQRNPTQRGSEFDVQWGFDPERGAYYHVAAGGANAGKRIYENTEMPGSSTASAKPQGGGLIHGNARWNQRTGKWETPIDWGKVGGLGALAGLTLGAGSAGLLGSGIQGALGGGTGAGSSGLLGGYITPEAAAAGAAYDAAGGGLIAPAVAGSAGVAGSAAGSVSAKAGSSKLKDVVKDTAKTGMTTTEKLMLTQLLTGLAGGLLNKPYAPQYRTGYKGASSPQAVSDALMGELQGAVGKAKNNMANPIGIDSQFAPNPGVFGEQLTPQWMKPVQNAPAPSNFPFAPSNKNDAGEALQAVDLLKSLMKGSK